MQTDIIRVAQKDVMHGDLRVKGHKVTVWVDKLHGYR